MYVLVVVDVAVDVAVSRATNAVTIAIVVSSSISTFSSKAGAASDWHGSSSNETVNYLSYSRHAGFAVPWKTHITCSIRIEPHIDFYHAIGDLFLGNCSSKRVEVSEKGKTIVAGSVFILRVEIEKEMGRERLFFMLSQWTLRFN